MNGKWLRSTAVVLGTAAVVHTATIYLLPFAVMRYVSGEIASHGSKNDFIHVPPVTADLRVVVLPSPDLLYSFCVFDVRQRPVRVRADVPHSYWSLSMFAANTDNFFVLNEGQVDGETVDVLLAGPQTPLPAKPQGRLVRSPSSRGVILIRMLVRSPEERDALVDIQHRATCRPD